MSLTNHVWDGFWIVANGAAWKRLPEDIQAIANDVFGQKALLQRADLVTLNQGLVDTLKGKGLEINTPDTQSFRDKLKAAGFYVEWRKQIGEEAWGLLERTTGALG